MPFVHVSKPVQQMSMGLDLVLVAGSELLVQVQAVQACDHDVGLLELECQYFLSSPLQSSWQQPTPYSAQPESKSAIQVQDDRVLEQ